MRKDFNDEEKMALLKVAYLIEMKWKEDYPSVTQFARQVKVDEKTIRKIIKAELNPSFLILHRISSALSFDSLADFFVEVERFVPKSKKKK